MKRPENVDFVLNDIKSNILDSYVNSLENRIDKAIEIMYDKGTFNLDNEYGKVFAELLDILKGSDSNE